MKNVYNNKIKNIPQKKRKKKKKEETLSKKYARQGHAKESEKKVLTYLTRSGQLGKFAIQPIPTHSHKLPRRTLIGVGKTGYQPNHSVSSLKVIPILQAPPNSIQEVNIVMAEAEAIQLIKVPHTADYPIKVG